MKRCAHCGGPKPKGQGRRYCSPACLKLGPTETKVCEDCGQERHIGPQIKAKARYCVECNKRRAREYARRYYAENREKVLADVKAYTQTNHEKVKASKRDHYQRHRDEIRARQAAYAAAHREEARERNKRWYRENAQRQRERSRRWKMNNPERHRANQRRWMERLKQDKEAWARHLEIQRINERLRLERKGKPIRPVPEPVYLKRYGDGRGKAAYRLDAGPLRKALARSLEEITVFAERTPLSESFVHRISLGQVRTVSVRDADILCVALGLPLTFVYPELAQTG